MGPGTECIRDHIPVTFGLEEHSRQLVVGILYRTSSPIEGKKGFDSSDNLGSCYDRSPYRRQPAPYYPATNAGGRRDRSEHL